MNMPGFGMISNYITNLISTITSYTGYTSNNRQATHYFRYLR